ncbi:TPA: hypothetical protein HML87_22480 [Escherichia coli]|nr:hypothetical protein [Escherichia coli]
MPRDDYLSAGLKTPGRREDKCPSARAGKRQHAGGAERGRPPGMPMVAPCMPAPRSKISS